MRGPVPRQDMTVTADHCVEAVIARMLSMSMFQEMISVCPLSIVNVEYTMAVCLNGAYYVVHFNDCSWLN